VSEAFTKFANRELNYEHLIQFLNETVKHTPSFNLAVANARIAYRISQLNPYSPTYKNDLKVAFSEYVADVFNLPLNEIVTMFCDQSELFAKQGVNK